MTHYYRDDLRMGLTRPHYSWNQAAWYIDPQNRTGLADDRNDGATPSTPVQTWNGGVANKLGCLDPVLPQFTTFNFMSGSPTDGSDPVIFRPILANKSGLKFACTLDSHNLVASGTLGSVTVKNRTTGQVLQADLGASAAVDQIVVNTTVGKSSRAIVQKLVSGTVYQITQPQTISDNWPVSGGDPSPVDTWANGDTFQLYAPDMVDFSDVRPVVAEFDNLLANEFTIFLTLGVLNPAGSLLGPVYLGDTMAAIHCVFKRRPVISEAALARNAIFWGCSLGQGMRGGNLDIQLAGNAVWIMGGYVGGMQAIGAYLDQDVILTSVGSRLLGGQLGSVCVDSGAILKIQEEVVLTAGYGGALLWGKGTTDVKAGSLFLSGVTAVASLLQPGAGGAITLNGQANAFSATLANPSVVNGAVPLTPAHIDAAAGAAGFGGNAFIPGGGSIRTFG